MNIRRHIMQAAAAAAAVLLLTLLPAYAHAAKVGTWKNYLSYYDISYLCEGGGHVWALASGNLFSYNPTDGDVQTYDRVNGLSATGIKAIAWCQGAHRLVVVYSNGLIDFISEKGDIVCLSDFYSKTTSLDKTVNGLTVSGSHAYISMGFGILDIDVTKAVVANTFNLGTAVNATLIHGQDIVAATASGVYTAKTTDNLLDRTQWRQLTDKAFTHTYWLDGQCVVLSLYDMYTIDLTTGALTFCWKPGFTNICATDKQIVFYGYGGTYFQTTPQKHYTVSTAIYALYPTGKTTDKGDEYWTCTGDGRIVKGYFAQDGTCSFDETTAIQADGPKYQWCGLLKIRNSLLYSTSGYSDTNPYITPTIQVWDGSAWTIYDESFVPALDHSYLVGLDFDIDPKDPNHLFLGTRTGLYEFQSGKLTKAYDIDNSPLKEVEGISRPKNYTYANGTLFDDDGRLWVFNGFSNTTSLMSLHNGKWTQHHNKAFTDNDGRSFIMQRTLMRDSRGLYWMTNYNWTYPVLACYQPSADPDTEGGDAAKKYPTFVNEDGTTLEVQTVSCCAEDNDHNIWIGTDVGPIYLPSAQIGTDNDIFMQVKVPRNDGTNLADYLLTGINTTAIAVDGAGRKWFGTAGHGIYLISADNMEQVQHFTTDNSALISDDIQSIAIDGKSGEVYIGTDKGLCSYTSEASDPADDMTKDNVYAYPNPVRPDYTGYITVTGLTLDADVKIVTSSGALVAQGHSTGGSFLWDGCDTKGKPVASGVYMVVTAKADGSKGTVCKIAVVR